MSHASLTFAELDAQAAGWAAYLKARGIGRGMRCLVLVRPGLPLIAVTFGIFRIGAVPVLIDPGMGLRSFLTCVARTRPQALVAIRFGHLISRLFWWRFSSVRHRVLVPGTLEARCPDGTVAGDPVGVDPQEVAALLFTSGSTGMPKGVVYTHGHFEAQVDLVRSSYGIEPGEVDMTLLPIFALFNPALGMATVVPEIDPRRPAALDPAKVVEAIHLRGVTNAFGAPPLWNRIAQWCEREGRDLAPMRRILLAGAAVPPPLVERLKRLLPSGEVHTPYGATESLPVATLDGASIIRLAKERPPELGPGVCVGNPVSGMKVALVEPDVSPARPWTNPGRRGEILVSGPVVTAAYDGLPEQTAKAKVRLPEADGTVRLWHRMGDIGYLDEEGRIWVEGRYAERVELPDGQTLYAEQVEPAFNRHPCVAKTALILFEQRGTKSAAIVVEPLPGAFPRDFAQRAAFAKELAGLREPGSPSAKVTSCFFLDRLPVDVRHNAKIHRLALARRAQAGRLGSPLMLGD